MLASNFYSYFGFPGGPVHLEGPQPSTSCAASWRSSFRVAPVGRWSG